MSEDADPTTLLLAKTRGDEGAAQRLAPLVYDRLRAKAHQLMAGERANHTLPPTALVHEAFLRLIDQKRVDWQGKTHFLAVAALQMRRILIDSARARKTDKRGAQLVTLDEDLSPSDTRDLDVLALDQALQRLRERSPRQAQIVELRFFAGMTVDEVAHVIGVSDRTIRTDWAMARAWLARELGRSAADL